MRKDCPTFGVHLDNIPTINLRNEFNTHLHLLRQEEFRASFRTPQIIQTPFFTWHGMPDEALSLLVLRAISGLESWIVGAAWTEFAATGRLNGRGLEAVRNPSSLGGRSMAATYYRLLPGLVYDHAALDRADPALWNRTLILYREIRNPLMHGHQIQAECVDGVLECFEHLAKLYAWTDSWHDWRGALHWPPKTPPVHIVARRLRLHFPLEAPLTAEDCRLTAEDLVRDGQCSPIPAGELTSCRTLGEFLACAERYRIAPPSSA